MKDQQGANIGETESTGGTEVEGKPTEKAQTRGDGDTQQLVGYDDVARAGSHGVVDMGWTTLATCR